MQLTRDLFAIAKFLLGHVLRKNELEAIVLTGKIEGKRARGRQRNMFLDWVSFACGNDGQESRF